MPLDRCPWYIAGPALGVLIVALRAMVNKPLGALGGYIDLAASGGQPRRLGFSAYLLIGIVLGGAVFRVLTRATPASALYAGILPDNPVLQVGVLTIAGLAMGVGARTAGGCTSGHGLTGVSLGSPASMAATMTFFATAVALTFILASFFGGAW